MGLTSTSAPWAFRRAGASRRLVPISLLVAAAACASSGAGHAAPGAGHRLEWAEVLRLRHARDYFTLRDRLAANGTDSAPPVRVARALVEHAFNRPAASNATIAALLSHVGLPDSVTTMLRQMQVSNDLRQFAYRDGLVATEALLAHGTNLDVATVRDLRNTQRIFRALVDVPAQTSTMYGRATLRIEGGRVPVQVNDSARHYVFDTGANLSTIMRSEARALGLRLYPAGIKVGTSTDQRVLADLAVADRLTLGKADYRNVVFLVLDDSLLTFPGGLRIPGIIGFPVIEQLGEVQVSRAGEVIITDQVTARRPQNLTLDELTPLTRVRWTDGTDEPLLCRLDTGADRTQFYLTFRDRFRALLDRTPSATRQIGGAGGVRELPVRVLPHPRLALGDTVVVLDSVDVLTQSVVQGSEDEYLDCNVGHDVLDRFPRYIVNFRDMVFLLR